MRVKRSTFIPNILFDNYLPDLSAAELKVILIILRQTNGWHDKRTGRRKSRDRMSYGQLMSKTKLSRRMIGSAVQKLIERGLVVVTNAIGQELLTAKSRQGKRYLFYAFNDPEHVQKSARTCAKNLPEHVQKGAYNKRNYTKENKTKLTRVNGLHHIHKYLKKFKVF